MSILQLLRGRTGICRKPKMRAQAAVEFMIFFGVIIVIMIAVAYNSNITAGQINAEKETQNIQDDIESIRSRIDMVYLGGSGFSANITLPEMIAGKDYEINITKGFLVINISGKVRIVGLMTDSITGTIEKGPNTISNANGELVIS